jgi:DNA polymerase I-like protein with 3'-5' exonuclease and polymerase domains
MKHTFKIVESLEEIDKVIEYCQQTGYCSFDIETFGKYYEDDSFITILGISFQPGSAYVIPLWHYDSPFKAQAREILQKIGKHLLENPKVTKIAYNAQYEYCWLLKYGIQIKGRLFDAMLAKHLLNEERPNDLGYVSGLIFPEFAGFKDETELLARKYGWDKIPLDSLSTRNALDCDLTLRLMFYFEPKLIKLKFYKLFRNLLMMNVRNLAESSHLGYHIDTKYLSELGGMYREKLDNLTREMLELPAVKKYESYKVRKIKKVWIKTVLAEIKELREDPVTNARKIKLRESKLSSYLLGQPTVKKEREMLEPLNPKSGKQLIDFFFTSKKGLKLTPTNFTQNKKTKQRSGNPSVAEDALKELQYYDSSGFIEKLLEYNKSEHIYSTYVKGMLERVSSKGKVHTSYLIHGTVTGRISSKDPNLQNIPRSLTSKDIKKMFIPRTGNLILEVDYSQAELRLVAELSKDEAMIEIFKRGYNIHVATACKVNGVLDRYEEIQKIIKNPDHPDNPHWEKQKKRAKLINFGILYGQTKKKLAIELQCSESQAQAFIDAWFSAYPQAKAWIDRQHKMAQNKGYVKNIFGRKRRLPNATMSEREARKSGLFGFWLEALRQSVNAPIQGGSSDLTQFAGIVIREKILMGEISPLVRQIYTVHDSIGFDIPPHLIPEVTPKLVEICANPDTLEFFGFQMKYVNMKVSPEIGITWGDIHDYDPAMDYTKLLDTT